MHADLVTATPFAAYNGIVARAAERLVLVARGVDPASLVVPEAGHLALRAEYESNLRGYRDGGRSGLHSWLLYGAEAQARAPRRARSARTGERSGPPTQTGERHRDAPETWDVSMPLDTRIVVTRRALSNCGPRQIRDDQRPVGRVDRRVGTGTVCGLWSC